MKREELLHLKEELKKEKEKRERIKELLQENHVQELITLTSTNYSKFIKDDYELLLKILKDYKVTNTNNIYVATAAYYTELILNDGLKNIYHYVPIDSEEAIAKSYLNIEDGSKIQAWISEQAYDRRIETSKFERNNIVLNPYNSSDNNNGYEEVRREFLENALKYGEEESKKLLLEKYPRLGGE